MSLLIPQKYSHLRANAVALALATLIPYAQCNAAEEPVNLGSAATFAVLASSAVTTIPTTKIDGDIGVWPGTSITGAPIVKGSIHPGDATAAQAQADAVIAYNNTAGRSVAPILVAGNIGGLTLAPGLYRSSSSLAISSGDLTLDAQGDPNAVWIFQIASTLTTTSGRLVILKGGADPNNIFWQVGSSATLGTTSDMKGTVLAFQALTMNTGATLRGRAIALNAGVALDTNTIKLPTTAPSSLVGNTVDATISSGTGSLSSTGQFQFAAATGANLTYLLAPLSGTTPAERGSYTYEKTLPTSATLTFNGVSMSLLFNDKTSGIYTATNSDGTQSGSFVMSRTLPDANNDGLGDIYLKNGDDILRAYHMKGTTYLRQVVLRNVPSAVGLTVVGQGDVNRDGNADILFKNESTGAMIVWYMKKSAFLGSSRLAKPNLVPAGWVPVAVADFNADRRPDILFHTQEGGAVVWLLNRTKLTSEVVLGGPLLDTTWSIAGTGDFNGDLYTDIAWQKTDGRVTVWNMLKVKFLSESALQTGPDAATGWKIRGIADFDFDGKTDLLYQNNDGRTEFWFYDNHTFLGISEGPTFQNDTQRVIGPN